MSFQVPKEFEEPKEAYSKMVSFWLKASTLKRFDTRCRINRVDRSKVLRLMVNLFLLDNNFEMRVVEGIQNNGSVS